MIHRNGSITVFIRQLRGLSQVCAWNQRGAVNEMLVLPSLLTHFSVYFSPNLPRLSALQSLTPSIKTRSLKRNAALEMSSGPWRPGQDGDHLLPRPAASLEPLGTSRSLWRSRARRFSVKHSVPPSHRLSSLLVQARLHSVFSQLISVCPQSL